MLNWTRRDSVAPFKDGLTVRDNDRAGSFAIGHEDVAIPILIDAIKVKLSDKQTAKSKQTDNSEQPQ